MKRIAALVALSALARAQEEIPVEFDLVYDGPPPVWIDIVWAIPAYTLLLLAWIPVGRWAERNREHIPWKRLRLWVPLGALTFSATIAAIAGFASEELFALELVNAPAILPLLPVLYLGMDLNPPYLLALWISALCVGWYGWVRALEWRAWRNSHLSLIENQREKAG